MCARRWNTPTTIFPERSTRPCSATKNACRSAPCTVRSRPSKRRAPARPSWRATSRGIWRPPSPTGRKEGARWAIAGAAASAPAR
ncbi:hypothetical protein G6F32_017284 [Rhizopus arrhizus]|nr:hypothetical protein G6F32_017284 [Rhizopus arrhizus]